MNYQPSSIVIDVHYYFHTIFGLPHDNTLSQLPSPPEASKRKPPTQITLHAYKAFAHELAKQQPTPSLSQSSKKPSMPSLYDIQETVREVLSTQLDRQYDRLAEIACNISNLESKATFQGAFPPHALAVMRNDAEGLGEKMSQVVERLGELLGRPRPGVEVWNEEGTVRFGKEWLQGGQGCDMCVANKSGTVEFGTETAHVTRIGAWGAGSSVLKLVVAGGLAYVYRKELHIIGRGILAGANLAIENWELSKAAEAQRNWDGPKAAKDGANEARLDESLESAKWWKHIFTSEERTDID